MSVAWNHLECSKVLVSLGADPQLRTRHGETVIELALRYNRTECSDFLNCVGEWTNNVDIVCTTPAALFLLRQPLY